MRKQEAGEPIGAEVEQWLNTTGFAVEAETARRIHRHGYFRVKAPAHYADLDGKTVKELDVLASKTGDARRLNDDPRITSLRRHYFSQETLDEAFAPTLTVSLRIECKYATQPWVVFSEEAEHGTRESMAANFMTTADMARLLDVLGKAPPDAVPLLHNEGVLGRSLRQAKVATDGKLPSNTDDCYKAIMSALVSSKHAVGSQQDRAELCIPVIVIKGKPLFNASTDAEFELSHRQVGTARLLYKLPNDMDADYVVDVVHLDDLDAYLAVAERTVEGIFQAFAESVYQALHVRAVRIDRRRREQPPSGGGWP